MNMIITTCVNNFTCLVKKSKGKQELSCDVLHRWERNPGLRKEATVFRHVRTHRFHDEADVVSIRLAMLELI